jgi:predicted acylesterase/phospholipase RssA
MTVQLDNFELVDVSYKTHPYWTVVEAVYASSCAPIFFKPFMKKGKLYTDGGIISNYPLQRCMENVEKDEGVLGICVNNISIGEKSNVDFNSEIGENLYEYLQHIVKNLCRRANKTLLRSKPTIEVIVPTTIVPIHDLYSFANSVDVRKRLIEHGGECCCCDK